MNKKNGFTIVELAIVLLIVAVLLGGLMMGLSGQIEQRRVSETQKGLDDIKEALIGYAIKNKHLPCPDIISAAPGGIANDGVEDVFVAPSPLVGQCVKQDGNIPWATLGVSDVDAWGHRFHYSVTPAYSQNTLAPGGTFTLASAGLLSVCQTTTAPAGACVNPLATALPAVILSFGNNGKGAITNTGALIPAAAGPVPTPPATNADEYQNSKVGALVFVNRPPSSIGGSLGEFDDQVTWLTSNILNSRMISAQQLP